MWNLGGLLLRGFPESDWISFSLSPTEAENKRNALLVYHSQLLIMSHYLMSFARGNELFLLDPKWTEKELESTRCWNKAIVRKSLLKGIAARALP